MKLRIVAGILAGVLCTAVASAKGQGQAYPGLAGTTILIVRHAEKPDAGPELAPPGVQRAQAYARYFKKFSFDGKHVTPDYIVAASDSKNSMRPRLTCTPTSQALHLAIDTRYADKAYASLANDLESNPHGKVILVCWHHGEIPSLVNALGANWSQLSTERKWPTAVFGWVVALKYDKQGRLTHEELIHENLMPDDAGQ